jgi:protease I
METKLKGKRIAILVENGFEEVELTEPKKALEEAGATAKVVSPEKGQVRAWRTKDWGKEIDVDLALDKANVTDFDALLLPGGVMNPDKLRLHPKAIELVRSFVQTGKPIAAICHGPWTLINAGAAKGRRMTSWPSLEADLKNAGATWVDQEVCVDRGVVTSRKPDDIPAFNAKMIEEFARGPQKANDVGARAEASASPR